MGFLTLGFPFEAMLPMTSSMIGSAAVAVRPLIGLGIFATLLVLFRPLLTGLVRAGLLLVSPRKTLEERRSRARMDDMIAINQFARSVESQHPGLASELRAMAMRD